MHVGVAGALSLLLLAACGQPSVAERLDALVEGGARCTHTTLPSPARRAVLHPEDGNALGTEVPDSPHARALLQAGAASVPDLVRLLDDDGRRTPAAFFLGEIGGEQAAAALLKRWRALRSQAIDKRAYDVARDRTLVLGNRYEGVDATFYGEMLHALCYAGLPVSAAVAQDTLAAMEQAYRSQERGDRLEFEERRETPAGTLELRWRAEPIETSCEGLQVLAMVGAPEAPEVFRRALRSAVRTIQWTAIQNVYFLGDDAAGLLPILDELLDHDDPRVRDLVLEELLLVLGFEGAPLGDDLSGDARDELVRRCRQRIRASSRDANAGR